MRVYLLTVEKYFLKMRMRMPLYNYFPPLLGVQRQVSPSPWLSEITTGREQFLYSIFCLF